MLIESYMRMLIYVFCLYKTSTFFTFQIFVSITTPSSVLFCNFVKFQKQSFYIQKDSQMNLYYRLI